MRILFVDDDVSVLEGLRRMLRKQRSQWEMQFVTNGPEALKALAESPFDVLVTDMQMPGMSGAELLERTVELYPGLGRIVLSGHADEALAIRASRLAHQFLAKPADPETLKEAVARARPQSDVIGGDRVREMVGQSESLPVLPAICAELTRLLESDQADAKSVGRIVSRDMGMSAKILQLVNSSFFGVGRRVSNVETAVNLLGMLRVRALVLREQIFTVFSLPRPIEYFSAERLWHRSLRVAELARQISRAEGQSDDRPDQAFTAGLLHDAGVLLLARLRPEFAAIMRTIHDERRPNVQVEMELLNVTHAEVGAYLLNLWGLPLRIVEAVALHHEPSQVSYDGPCAVTAVHVADALLSEAEETTPDSVSRMMSPRLDLAYLQRIGLEHRIDRWRSCALEITQLAEEVPA